MVRCWIKIASHWTGLENSRDHIEAFSSWRIDDRRRHESDDVRRRLQSTDRVIILDERGEQVTSEVFAGWLQSSMNGGIKRVVFVIGGPFGHDPSLRQEAWKVLGFCHGVESRDGAVASIRTVVSGQYDYLGWVLPPLVKVDVRCWILRLHLSIQDRIRKYGGWISFVLP